MSTYELRIKDERRLVESVAALTALVRTGALTRLDLVSKDGAAPIPAEKLPELREAFGLNIWSAWDELDEEAPAMPPSAPAAAEIREAPVRTAPPETPPQREGPATPKRSAPEAPKVEAKRAPTPSERSEAERPGAKRLVIISSRRGGTESAAEPELLPAAAVEPLVSDPGNLDPHSDEPRGEVIAFPGPARQAPRRAMPRLIEPDDDAKPLYVKRDAAEPERVPARWWWMGALLALGVLATAIGVWYMRSVALWTNPAPVLVEAPEPAPMPAEEVATPSEDAVIEALRAKIPADAGAIEGTDEAFGDLLFIELQRVVSPRTVDVRVLARTRTDIPEVVEFTFMVNASGDVLQDLGAVALVAGKYKSQYDLQVRRIEVIVVESDGSSRSRELSPEGCAQLWNGKIKLADLLLPK